MQMVCHKICIFQTCQYRLVLQVVFASSNKMHLYHYRATTSLNNTLPKGWIHRCMKSPPNMNSTIYPKKLETWLIQPGNTALVFHGPMAVIDAVVLIMKLLFDNNYETPWNAVYVNWWVEWQQCWPEIWLDAKFLFVGWFIILVSLWWSCIYITWGNLQFSHPTDIYSEFKYSWNTLANVAWEKPRAVATSGI